MQFHAKYPLFDSQSDSEFSFSYAILKYMHDSPFQPLNNWGMIFQIYALGIELYFYANSPTVLENQCGCTPNCKKPFICTKKLSLAKAYMIAFWWKSGLDENMLSWNVYGTKKEASIFRERPPSHGYSLQAALTKKAQCINEQWSLYKSWVSYQ